MYLLELVIPNAQHMFMQVTYSRVVYHNNSVIRTKVSIRGDMFQQCTVVGTRARSKITEYVRTRTGQNLDILNENTS